MQHDDMTDAKPMRIISLPGATVIDLRDAHDPAALRAGVDRARLALAEYPAAPILVWVATPASFRETGEGETAVELGSITAALYACFGAHQEQILMFDGPDADPALVYVLRSLGMEVFGPSSLELKGADGCKSAFPILSLLDEYR